MITSVTEALAAAVEALAVHGKEVRLGATEYRQDVGFVQLAFSLHLGESCRRVSVISYSDETRATWEAALDKLRSTHVEVVAGMRAEVERKAAESAAANTGGV